MKVISFLLLLLIGFLINCLAQDTVRRNIPMLKESAKIDSLIVSINNISGNSKAPKNDSCILFYLTNTNGSFIEGLHAANHKTIIFSLTDFEKDKNVGYFEFNNYLIFVYGDKFVNQFFKYSKSTKEFTFIKLTTNQYFNTISQYLNWAVFYDDGHLNYGVH